MSVTLSASRSAWLRGEMEARGILQRHIVNATGIDVGSVSQFLNGKRPLPEEKAARIEDYLQIPGVLTAPDPESGEGPLVELAKGIEELAAFAEEPDDDETDAVDAPTPAAPELEDDADAPSEVLDEAHAPTPEEREELFAEAARSAADELVSVAASLEETAAGLAGDPKPARYTIAQVFDVRDAVAEAVERAGHGVDPEAQHYAIAEALLGLGYIDVPRVLEADS